MNAVLTQQELEAVIARGHACEKGECSIDDVDGLIAELQDQQHNLNERIKEMDNMIKSLEILNDADDRDHDEVRDTCLLYTSPSPRDMRRSRMPSSA